MIVAFFKNRWTKFVVSFVSLGYGLFLGYLAWLAFTHYLVPENTVSLFALYLFVNLIFGIIMTYTRKCLITQIVSLFLHPCLIVLLVVAFGNWYMLAPPLVIATVIFFASGASETLKTVLGTIYMIIAVLAVVGYLLVNTFGIRITDIDLTKRSTDYVYSPNRVLRLVKYIDDESDDNRSVSYYVERTENDVKLPFIMCYGYTDSAKVLTSPLSHGVSVKWLDDGKLLIDGVIKNVSETSGDTGGSSITYDGETIILTTSAETTATAPPDNGGEEVSLMTTG